MTEWELVLILTKRVKFVSPKASWHSHQDEQFRERQDRCKPWAVLLFSNKIYSFGIIWSCKYYYYYTYTHTHIHQNKKISGWPHWYIGSTNITDHEQQVNGLSFEPLNTGKKRTTADSPLPEETAGGGVKWRRQAIAFLRGPRPSAKRTQTRLKSLPFEMSPLL